MTVDPRSDRAIYRQVADILRAEIANGVLAPGSMLPSEKQLADSFGIGRDAVRQAIALLRSEGLIRSAKGMRAAVRTGGTRRAITLAPGSRAIARMPTDKERTSMGIDHGVPVLEITDSAGAVTVLSADSAYVMAEE